MSESMHVTEYLPEHQKGLFSLYSRHFGAWAAARFKKRWEWQCGANNPLRALRPISGLVVLHGDQVIGGFVLFPVPWWVNGERLIFLSGGDFAIDDQFRGAAFMRLSREIMCRPPAMVNGLHPSLRKLGTRVGAIVLPLSRIRYSLHLRKRGWLARAIRARLPAFVGRLVSPATVGWLLASRRVEGILRRLAHGNEPPVGTSLPDTAVESDIRSLARFGSDYDILWKQVRQKYRMTLDKDAAYLNWRYVDCPTLREPIVRGLYRDGKLSGIVVAAVCVTLDERRRPCGINGEILELIADDASVDEINALLLSACRELDLKRVDAIGASGHDDTVREALRTIGFRADEDSRFDNLVLFDLPDPKTGRVESVEGIYITAGDGDLLNAFLL